MRVRPSGALPFPQAPKRITKPSPSPATILLQIYSLCIYLAHRFFLCVIVFSVASLIAGVRDDGADEDEGEYTSACGEHYSGEWCLGLRSGKGKMYYRQGQIYDGEWLNGENQER